jgi:magnesium transporter
MLNFFYKTAKDDEFQTIDQPREGCWIHIDLASIEDLNQLTQLTGLEYNDLQDCLDKYEIPRIEKIKEHLIIFIRYPNDQEAGFYTSVLTMILTNQYFITISPQKCPFIQSFLMRRTTLETPLRPKILIQLLLKMTQDFTSEIKRVRHNVLKQEKEMINVESDDITTLTKNEEILNQYHSVLSPTIHVLSMITSGKYADLYEKEKDFLEDLLNSAKQSEDICSSNLKSIRSLRDSYQIIFTNNLHKTIKLLTALTIIFSIPTMIASLYGMNIDLPVAKSSYAFIFIICFIFMISAAALLIFRHKKWL